MNARWKNRITHMVASASMLGMLGGLNGCVSYTNVPGPKSAPAFQSVNHTQSISVVASALSTVIEKYPPAGQYTINLPAGTSRESFDKIIARLPEGVILPTHGMSEDLPVYHIGRIWIRASDAKVDVIYPFTRDDGTVQEQNVTLWLSGGVRKWRVYRQQHWAPGTISTPELYVPNMVQEPVTEPIEEPAEAPAEVVDDEAAEESATESNED